MKSYLKVPSYDENQGSRAQGRSFTLAELKKWVAEIYNDQIEKRAAENYNLIAAGNSGMRARNRTGHHDGLKERKESSKISYKRPVE